MIIIIMHFVRLACEARCARVRVPSPRDVTAGGRQRVEPVSTDSGWRFGRRAVFRGGGGSKSAS